MIVGFENAVWKATGHVSAIADRPKWRARASGLFLRALCAAGLVGRPVTRCVYVCGAVQPFVKLVKNKAYFKRFQVKYRRRREGKTDYRARKRLCVQDKNKYLTPKFRLVVRFSNQFVLCQIVQSKLDGDYVFSSASSRELPRYGVKTGLKNYAAAYATGLLIARRTLQKLKLDAKYTGNEDVTGEIKTTEWTADSGRKRVLYVSEADAERKPFRALLDVGVRNTTRGNRVFGALKGASDGGLDVPHNEKRFPGYDAAKKEYDASAHRARIFGGHIAEYMKALSEENGEKYAKQFALYEKDHVSADGLEELYAKVHAAIRENPSAGAKSTKAHDLKFKCKPKHSYILRKAKVQQKKARRLQQLAEGADD